MNIVFWLVLFDVLGLIFYLSRIAGYAVVVILGLNIVGALIYVCVRYYRGGDPFE